MGNIFSRYPPKNTRIAESGSQLASQITVAGQAYAAGKGLQVVKLGPGVAPPLYETNDGTATGTPLSELGVVLDYGMGWVSARLPDEPAALLPLGKKAVVILRCDDNRDDWLQQDDLAARCPNGATPAFGGITAQGSAAKCTPLEYAIRKGIPVTLAIITNRMEGAGRLARCYQLGETVYTTANPMTLGQMGDCVWRGGFELAHHTESHYTGEQSPTAANLLAEIVTPRTKIESIRHGAAYIIKCSGTASAGHYHLTMTGKDPSGEIAWNATYADTKTAISDWLTAIGYTDAAAQVELRGVPLASGFAVTIVIGDGRAHIIPTIGIDASALTGATTSTIVESNPTPLGQPCRGFVHQGNWSGETNINTALKTRNVWARLTKDNFVWSHAFWPNPLAGYGQGMVGGAHHFVGWTDIALQAEASTAIAALEQLFQPGTRHVITVHAVGNGGDFKELIDLLASMQEAGKVECVTSSTGMTAIACDPMPTIPGGDIASLPTLTTSRMCGMWALNNAGYFDKIVYSVPDTNAEDEVVVSAALTVTDDVGTLANRPLSILGIHGTVGATSTVFEVVPAARTLVAAGVTGQGECHVNYETGVVTFHADDDPTTVTVDYVARGKRETYLRYVTGQLGSCIFYLPSLRQGATHTLRFKCYTPVGQTNTQWIEVLRRLMDYPTPGVDAGMEYADFRTAGDNMTDLQYSRAGRIAPPAAGTAKLVTIKVFIPQDAAHKGCKVTVRKSTANDVWAITDVKWFLG